MDDPLISGDKHFADVRAKFTTWNSNEGKSYDSHISNFNRTYIITMLQNALIEQTHTSLDCALKLIK